MFILKKPSDAQIKTFIESQQLREFSYREVGATRAFLPSGFQVDHNRIRLGEGPEVYDHAITALRMWKHFDLGWVKLRPANAPIVVGSAVAVIVHHLAFWSLNACRIVYVIEEEADVKKFGFAYGTLPDHAESGEERFTIEWHSSDDSVWYDILAFSRPNKAAAKLGFPVTRMLQRRFARDSLAAMLKMK
ncbi:MAG: DUF1990 domain-containing protein [Pyrinomonadaceae bacterium]